MDNLKGIINLLIIITLILYSISGYFWGFTDTIIFMLVIMVVVLIINNVFKPEEENETS